MINTSNSGYFYMNYYLHIFLPLMHFYIRCITYDLSVIVEWRTGRCGIHVHDTLSHCSLHLISWDNKTKSHRTKMIYCLYFFLGGGYVEPSKLHEGLTLLHQNRKYYTIYNRDRCTVFTNWRQTTLRQCTNVHVSQRRIQKFP